MSEQQGDGWFWQSRNMQKCPVDCWKINFHQDWSCTGRDAPSTPTDKIDVCLKNWNWVEMTRSHLVFVWWCVTCSTLKIVFCVKTGLWQMCLKSVNGCLWAFRDSGTFSQISWPLWHLTQWNSKTTRKKKWHFWWVHCKHVSDWLSPPKITKYIFGDSEYYVYDMAHEQEFKNRWRDWLCKKFKHLKKKEVPTCLMMCDQKWKLQCFAIKIRNQKRTNIRKPGHRKTRCAPAGSPADFFVKMRGQTCIVREKKEKEKDKAGPISFDQHLLCEHVVWPTKDSSHAGPHRCLFFTEPDGVNSIVQNGRTKMRRKVHCN